MIMAVFMPTNFPSSFISTSLIPGLTAASVDKQLDRISPDKMSMFRPFALTITAVTVDILSQRVAYSETQSPTVDSESPNLIVGRPFLVGSVSLILIKADLLMGLYQ